MERGEPSLVPEWLRSTGGGSGGGGSGHPLASSSTHSDSSSSSHGRSSNSKNVTSLDSPRSAYLDRSSSSNSRRNSINGLAKNAYGSSFIRSHRDKDRDKGKARLNFGGDPWGLDSGDSLASILTSHGDKDTLRRSHSMLTRKQGEILARKVAVDLNDGSGINHANGNGLISGAIPPKVVLEKDFPSLGSEERLGVPDVVRMSSPVLGTVSQSLPAGSSSLLTGEGWTSALVGVPNVIGSCSSGSSSGIQVASAAASGPSSAVAGLNMAEALTQAPPRARVAPQLSVQTQKREELAIKQSRQLIPVTPSMPKSLVLNSSDKSKPKTLVRSGEVAMTPKNMQQQPSSTHSVNQALLGTAKADAPKTSQGKLFVLKPGWENGASPSPKDVVSPTNNVNRATNGQVAVPLVPSAPPRSPNKKLSPGERKPSALNLMSGLSLEKKPSLSQIQSRNDFFNLLKKKSSTNASSVSPEQTSVVSSPTSGKPSELDKGVVIALASPQAVQECADLTDNGDNYEEVQSFSEEEEVAFLHSLGWEENAGDEEGLTEEEINAFYEEYKKKKPSLNLCPGVQQRLLECRANSVNGVSSELISSDSGSEA